MALRACVTDLLALQCCVCDCHNNALHVPRSAVTSVTDNDDVLAAHHHLVSACWHFSSKNGLYATLAMLWQETFFVSVTPHLLVIRQRLEDKKKLRDPWHRGMSDDRLSVAELWAET